MVAGVIKARRGRVVRWEGDSSKGKIVRMWPNLIGDGRDQVASAWSKLLKPGVDWCMSRVQTSRLIQRSVDCCMPRVQDQSTAAGCSRLMQFQRVDQSTGMPDQSTDVCPET